MTFEKRLHSVPERLLKYLVSWGSPRKYSMIGCFLEDAFGVLSFQFWSTVLQCDAWQHPKLLDRVVSGARFETGGVFENDIAHSRYVALLCMLNKIRCNPMHLLYMVLYKYCICASAGYMRWFGLTSVCLCASSQQNLAVQQDFYSTFSGTVGRSCRPCIRRVGLAGIKSRVKAILLT